jgi:hypothetical protein
MVGEDEKHQGRMRAPAVTCPRCGSRPALRLSEALVEAFPDESGSREIGSYKCQRRGCGYIYRITAAALRHGIPE